MYIMEIFWGYAKLSSMFLVFVACLIFCEGQTADTRTSLVARKIGVHRLSVCTTLSTCIMNKDTCIINKDGQQGNKII